MFFIRHWDIRRIRCSDGIDWVWKTGRNKIKSEDVCPECKGYGDLLTHCLCHGMCVICLDNELGCYAKKM